MPGSMGGGFGNMVQGSIIAQGAIIVLTGVILALAMYFAWLTPTPGLGEDREG
jgi:hypothetical protein